MSTEGNTTSKVRIWAEKQSQPDQKDQSIIKVLSNSIIYALSRFCSSSNHLDLKDKDGPLNEKKIKKVLAAYSGDATLFEMGCYLYFHIDLWHVQNDKDKYREGVVHRYLFKKFLEIFEDSLRIKNSHLILENRLDLYGDLIRNKSERIQFYLLQLVIRTSSNTLPVVHDFNNFHVMIASIFEEIVLSINIASFVREMIPICCKNLKIFYDSMTEELKQFLLSIE